ncbi:hypothetical protein H4R34_003158 [Dimargaris verticillata]|uniref:Inner membrane component domain-containing protein n=1 Tax=Dimargaris verticillata TaxID=2761393 RepID=A0A9W8B549_9FUNG|nr:hypothetical protein H4R34_003158 [Dimargaris verticillata]
MDPCIDFLCNIIWMLLGGWVAFLIYVTGGVLLCLSIVGLPFGYECFKLSLVGLWPFGKEIHWNLGESSTTKTVFNVVWMVLLGWLLCLVHLLLMVLFAVTLVGIPFAVQHWKLAKVALWPFGTTIAKPDSFPGRGCCPA